MSMLGGPRAKTRDYIAEMREYVDNETKEGAYVASLVAQRIVAKLRMTDPGLLEGWLQLQAAAFLAESISRRDHSIRAKARSDASRSVFKKAAAAAEAGDMKPITGFLETPFTLRSNVRKSLAEMTTKDLRDVAESYENRARDNRLTAAFLTAVANHLTEGAKVGDEFSDERLTELWQSIYH